MDNVNKTLYIPLYGKAQVSKREIILSDPKAEEIWEANAFPLKGKSRSKWLALYMGMRAAVFDRWVLEKTSQSDAVVLHMGCGMDSRVVRTGCDNLWYDIDFPAVIQQRQRFFPEQGNYRLLGADIREEDWLSAIPKGGNAVVVMEGLSMYLTRQELLRLMEGLSGHFDRVELLMDCYTEFAARASKYKNPINDVGVTQVYGLDDPQDLTAGTGFRLVGEHEMTPACLIDQLQGLERWIFRTLYGGAIANRMYRMYEFASE